MSFKAYVGIDVSKLKFDVYIKEKESYKQFKNDKSGFIAMVKWLQKLIEPGLVETFICFEHTGLYSLPLALFLSEEQIPFAMVAPLEIKRSLGITRGKNDIVDAKRIADFAYRFHDKINVTKLPASDLNKIHLLLTLRDRLSRNLGSYVASKNETERALGEQYLPELFTSYDTIIATIKAEIKRLENEIKEIIEQNEKLATSMQLLTSIKGIGVLTAAYLIVYTDNFTKFDNWRKFACYSGIAPFDYQSGTSVRGRTKVNSIANKQMKRMLYLAAICAISFDTELRDYYHRKQAEGKPKMLVINVIKNKLIARAFAVIKRGTPFVNTKKYAA